MKPDSLDSTFATYTVGVQVGQGGNGFVYEVANESGNKFAAKILNPSAALKKRKLKRFKNEILFGTNNYHDNIIRVMDHGLTQDDLPFFIMPLYEGSLDSLLPRIDEDAALGVFLKILNGVEAAHLLGVTHRDLKPQNILYRDNGDELVIADFGIALFNEEELYTAVETKDTDRLANFVYAAPEQKIRDREVTKSADIFSLGLILNELFTKEVPQGKNHKTIGKASEKHTYLDQVVDKMMQSAPGDRYGDIDAIKSDISNRGKEYVSRQKISKLKAKVIPEESIEDPFFDEPMEIVNVDFVDGSLLRLTMNHEVTPQWRQTFLEIASKSHYDFAAPGHFKFKNDVISLTTTLERAEMIVTKFKEWLPDIDAYYRGEVTRKISERKHAREADRKKAIKLEEERIELVKRLGY